MERIVVVRVLCWILHIRDDNVLTQRLHRTKPPGGRGFLLHVTLCILPPCASLREAGVGHPDMQPSPGSVGMGFARLRVAPHESVRVRVDRTVPVCTSVCESHEPWNGGQ